MRRVLICVFLMLSFIPCACARPAKKLVVVSWTDIHYGNEKYEPAAWHEAYDRGLALHPDVVVMTGDQMDNKCTKDEFLQRQEKFLGDLSKRLDRVKAPVMLVYGNNDFYSNYQTDPDVLKATTSMYARQMKKYCYLDDLGNGVYPKVVAGMTWISINSQIFSPANRYADRQAQADRTFAFLEKTLAALPQGRPVVLLLHIPPSYDLYDGKPSWQYADLERLGQVLRKHSGPLAILGAHYHRNEIHAFNVPGRGPVPLLVAGSISFKYGNYPNWRSMQWTLGGDGGVDRFDWINHYPGHPNWDTAWKLIRPYLPATYATLAAALRDNLQTYLHYMEELDAHNADWRKWADDPRTRPSLVEQVAPTGFAAPAGKP